MPALSRHIGHHQAAGRRGHTTDHSARRFAELPEDGDEASHDGDEDNHLGWTRYGAEHDDGKPIGALQDDAAGDRVFASPMSSAIRLAYRVDFDASGVFQPAASPMGLQHHIFQCSRRFLYTFTATHRSP